jgi:hypothetical protein
MKALALAAFLVLGCSSGKQSLEQRLGALEQQVLALQNDNDRLSERLGSVELPGPPARQEQPAESIERPPLKVVRLEPGPSAAADAEEEPRPVIRDTGSAKKRAGSERSGQNREP